MVVVVQRSATSSSSVVGIDGAGDGGSSRGGVGVRVGWVVVGVVVWRVSMAKEDLMRAAWREARKWALRVATAWADVRLRLAREEEVA